MRKVAVAITVVAALWLVPGAFAAWCGSGESSTDRLPDSVTAEQIHAIVAVPADAPDTFATNASQLSDDVASMVSWWAGQDATRIPRFDQALFGKTPCLDISFLRLPEATASYANMGASAAFQQIAEDLISAGFDDPYKKYLVYFEGPSVEEDVCGVGAGDLLSGPSFAIVLTGGCPDVPTDTTATHELLHALGAVPPGDTHCPADPGHPCDSPTDILYPTTDGSPLATKVLDYNHDDYYAHSEPWPDVQDSLWLHRLDEAPVSLSISFAGARRSLERVAGARLHRRVLDAVGSGGARHSRRRVVPLRPLRRLGGRVHRPRHLPGHACPVEGADGHVWSAPDPAPRLDEREGHGRLLTGLHQELHRRYCTAAEGGGGEGVEVRRVGRRVQGRARDVLARDRLCAQGHRALHEEALSQSRSSV